MKRGLLACVLAAVGLLAVYALVLALGAAAGRWSADTSLEQAAGLGVHATVVFVRGLLPAVVLTSALRSGVRRRNGRAPGLALTGALALGASLLVVTALLTSAIGDWPRLQVAGPMDAAATVGLLALGAGCADLAANRLAPPKGPPA